MSLAGIDVSDYQAVSSYHAAQSSGIAFVIAKATQGTGNVQSSFADNRDRVREVGMAFGAYHFLEWTNNSQAQVEHFLSVYTPQAGDLPPALDCEEFPHEGVEWQLASEEQRAIWRAENTSQIQAWLDAIKPHLSALPIVYASYAAVGTYFDASGFSGHPLWVAAYENLRAGFADVTPHPFPLVAIWQYTDGAGQPEVPGVGASVDRDLFNGDADTLKRFCLQGA